MHDFQQTTDLLKRFEKISLRSQVDIRSGKRGDRREENVWRECSINEDKGNSLLQLLGERSSCEQVHEAQAEERSLFRIRPAPYRQIVLLANIIW